MQDEIVTPETNADAHAMLHQWLDGLLRQGLGVSEVVKAFGLLHVAHTTSRPIEEVVDKFREDAMVQQATAMLTDAFGLGDISLEDKPCG